MNTKYKLVKRNALIIIYTFLRRLSETKINLKGNPLQIITLTMLHNIKVDRNLYVLY